jgi:hypothetical protein
MVVVDGRNVMVNGGRGPKKKSKKKKNKEMASMAWFSFDVGNDVNRWYHHKHVRCCGSFF